MCIETSLLHEMLNSVLCIKGECSKIGNPEIVKKIHKQLDKVDKIISLYHKENYSKDDIGLSPTLLYIDNVGLFFPINGVCKFKHLSEFPDSCGPGKGILEKIIPEEIEGIKVSPACWIHDLCWTLAKPTLEDFHLSNKIFMVNLITLLLSKPSTFEFINVSRVLIAVTYYTAVETTGKDLFFREKEKHENIKDEYSLKRAVNFKESPNEISNC